MLHTRFPLAQSDGKFTEQYSWRGQLVSEIEIRVCVCVCDMRRLCCTCLSCVSRLSPAHSTKNQKKWEEKKNNFHPISLWVAGNKRGVPPMICAKQKQVNTCAKLAGMLLAFLARFTNHHLMDSQVQNAQSDDKCFVFYSLFFFLLLLFKIQV